ncbi:hypothetical protein [Anoxybacteroides tepidamans]|uniref:hypothetical protein n=1 Tax=Anoxybacteroides tepidamans TaxID=265948 RepID=UPI00048362C4|nr:hypothetical protein [Anoxybacillus tepidamans]
MKKWLFAILLLSVFGFGYWIIKESKPPAPRITVGATNIPTAQGTYCWTGLFNGMCVDMSSPIDIIRHERLQPVVVSPGAELRIGFRREPIKGTLGVRQWMREDEAEDVNLVGNMFKAPETKGIYIYDVYASWEKGDASHVFVIQVK